MPFPTPGDLPDTGIKPASFASPALAGGFFTAVPPWNPQAWVPDPKARAANHRALRSRPGAPPPPPQPDGCRLGRGLTPPEQAGVGVPSLSDAATGEGRLPSGSVGGLPEAAARLPLHRRPPVRQAKEDISGVSVQGGWWTGGARPRPPVEPVSSLGPSAFFPPFLKTY